jgi:arabinose-5-phosphate isomerase
VFLHPPTRCTATRASSAGRRALFVSKSGESDELLALSPTSSATALPLVSIVDTPESTLARAQRRRLVTGPVREACPMDLTPTTSITLAQVMGDCLAVALLERRGFRPRTSASCIRAA